MDRAEMIRYQARRNDGLYARLSTGDKLKKELGVARSALARWQKSGNDDFYEQLAVAKAQFEANPLDVEAAGTFLYVLRHLQASEKDNDKGSGTAPTAEGD